MAENPPHIPVHRSIPLHRAAIAWWHRFPSGVTLPIETLLFGGICGMLVLSVIIGSAPDPTASAEAPPSGLWAKWMLEQFRPLEEMPALSTASADTEGVLTVILSAPEGTMVKAPASGEIVTAGPVAGHGYWITISTGDGTLYHIAHLAENSLAPGQRIRQGEALAQADRLGDDMGWGVLLALEKNGDLIAPSFWPIPPVQMAALLFGAAQ